MSFGAHLQALWLLGTVGALYLATQHPEQPLPLFVAQQPWATWLVGPAAAAVTGVSLGHKDSDITANASLDSRYPPDALHLVALGSMCVCH